MTYAMNNDLDIELDFGFVKDNFFGNDLNVKVRDIIEKLSYYISL